MTRCRPSAVAASSSGRPAAGGDGQEEGEEFYEMTPEDYAAMVRAANARKKVRIRLPSACLCVHVCVNACRRACIYLPCSRMLVPLRWPQGCTAACMHAG